MVDRGLKSTSGQESSAEYSLTSHKKFTQRPPSSSRKKFADSVFFHNIPSFHVIKFPLYGQMVTTALNRPRGNNAAYSTLQPHTRSLPNPTILYKNKILSGQHFFTILLHSRWTNAHLMGKWRLGIKIDLGKESSGAVLFNLTQNVYAALPILFKKKFANSVFFRNIPSFHVNKCPLYGQMETGA